MWIYHSHNVVIYSFVNNTVEGSKNYNVCDKMNKRIYSDFTVIYSFVKNTVEGSKHSYKVCDKMNKRFYSDCTLCNIILQAN